MLKMKSRYKISILTLSIFIASCNDWSQGKFEITNNTSKELDSIYIQPDRSLRKHFLSLKPHETKYYVTDMGGEGTDGAYTIYYKQNSALRSQIFGYYTNGSSMEKLTKVTIMPDTILFKFLND